MESSHAAPKTISTYRHDIRNHISVIRLYTQLLQQRLKEAQIDDPRFEQYITTIVNRTKQLEEEFEQFTV
ncbi:hypothetical protein C5B42_02635 [Candidatus Cerribacteria bacterium 'Amazon FNV 2010 28 9']|uniref:Signal transduction histidine kinase dimerisation/phosphoacceptor domain-containing protein n=1 Tax=Candidatus Cerribacteria bacterium 'Amazon FNV 2010 28 9' TaxID=2081795 RepID=A0A317JP23_9BACT|nr:MAG: hypothetical protein C5B42_02635 [Candidatus Cerribacteria bacterium 'Amazon FNV 2010 28 9']